MRSACFLFLMCCWCLAGFAAPLDFGPFIRIAQCRMQCLQQHSTDGTCDWYSNRAETLCSECWQNCETLETQWETSKSICEVNNYLRCPACQTACIYRQSRLEEEYLPSSFPAPFKGPVKLAHQDIAILMRKVGSTWKESGYYPGSKVPSLRQDTWIVAVVEDGVRHYSWEEWTPTLESLKEGPFVEASLSWKDVDVQLKRQRDAEQKRFNDRVRQFYLEKYGEKVLIERSDSQDTPIPEEVFRRFFFRRRNEGESQLSKTDTVRNDSEDILSIEKQESFVVSWEPETGGLMGNQVVDSTSTQISLLPGTKYLVRIASNEGPGSFPIEIDTRSNSVHVWRLKKKIETLYPWAILAGTVSSAIVLVIILFFKMALKKKTVDVNEI